MAIPEGGLSPSLARKKVNLTGIQMSFPFQCTPFCNLLCLGSWRVQESGLARNSFFCRLRSGGAFFWVVSTLSHGGGVLFFCPLQFNRGTFFSFLTSPLLSLPWLLHLHLLSVLKGLLRKEPCGFRGRERRRENEGMCRCCTSLLLKKSPEEEEDSKEAKVAV